MSQSLTHGGIPCHHLQNPLFRRIVVPVIRFEMRSSTRISGGAFWGLAMATSLHSSSKKEKIIMK